MNSVAHLKHKYSFNFFKNPPKVKEKKERTAVPLKDTTSTSTPLNFVTAKVTALIHSLLFYC